MDEGEVNEVRSAEKLSQHIKGINVDIQAMLDRLEENHIEFTIKRLRPTAAKICQNASGDANLTSKMLMHSTLSETGTYLKRIPDAKIKKSQESYENVIKRISWLVSLPRKK